MVVMCDLVHEGETVFILPSPLTATFFDLHVQCRIVLKFIFRVLGGGVLLCCCYM